MSNFKHSFFRTLLYAQLLSGFSGVAIAAQISLSVKDRPMREVIKELEETTEYRFFYSDGIKGLNSPVSVNVEDADINAVMDAIARQANVAYVLKSGHQIVLSSVKAIQQQDNKKVTGTITDPKGEPIIGANVVVKGSTNGTITDIDGHFSIEVTPNAILQVSYIGYVAQDILVGNKNNLVISIHEDTQKLDEVVVVGYGSQKKVNLTGAVEQVTSDVFEGRPTANATQMLEGVVPNLNISLSDGKPGRTADFNVRGAGSINGGSALVLIDGVEGDPSMLNPNDIESISVLKDAAASAIYGARAPFGVVLITTKNATEGKPKVTWSSSYSLQSPQNVPDVVSDGYIWAKHFYDAYFNYNQANPSGINKTQQFSVAWLDEYKRRHDTGDFGTVISDGSIGTKGRYVYYPEGTDYYDLMYKKNVFAQNQNLSLSGSDGKFDYYLSGRFYSYDGLFDSDEQTDKFKTYNMRFKGGYQLTPWLKISDNFEFSHNKYYNPTTYSEGSGVVWRNIADEGHPSSPLFNPDGTLTYAAVYTVGDLLYGRSGITTKNSNLKNTTTFNAKFLDGRLRVNGDFTYQQKTQEKTKKQVRSPYARSVDANGESKIEHITGTYSNLAETTDHTNYLATNLFAEFEETFAEKHYFKAMAGWNYEKSSFKRIYAYNDDLLTDDVDNMNLAMGTDNRNITSQWKAYQFGGAFFRLNYAFDDRYLLEVNGRYDGSSRFPSNERWAFFPSASVGWRISQEPWWNVKSEHISNAKIRFSWGSLGNAAGLSNYQYIQTLGISKSDYILDGLRQNYMSSPAALPGNLTWETATTYDVGADLGFFDNRLTVSADYYIRKTTDMIVNGPTVPDVFGASSPKGNYADMSTYGYELSLEWKDGFDLAGKRFNYSVKGTLADYYSVIDKFNNTNMSLSERANQSLDKNYYEGMRIGELWGFVSNGLWQDQAGIDAAEAAAKAAGQSYYNPLMQTSKTYKLYPGDIKFEDLNGNGYIDRGQNTVDDSGDRKVIGNEEPRYIYSFTLSADWNNIWVSAFFQGVGKQDWYPSNEASTFWGQYNRPYNQMPSWHVDNYWTPENPDAFLPRYAGYYAPFYSGHKNANTRYLMNAAYLRLKNLQIGYNLPSAWIKKLYLTNVGVYLSGENLFTWSPLYKYSKDVNVSNIGESDKDLTSSNSGDGYNYPMMKSFSIGLSVTF
ncbi:MAG: TonB-dependent receptor [Parabacteroides sp.]|nr:TonB-dependent receptor [Parabacteroides sp.]